MKNFALYYCALCLSLWAGFAYFDPDGFSNALLPALKVASPQFFYWQLIVSTCAALGLSLTVEFFIVGWNRSAVRKALHPSASTLRDQITCALHVTDLLDLIGYVLTLGLPFFFGQKLIQLFPALQKLEIVLRSKEFYFEGRPP